MKTQLTNYKKMPFASINSHYCKKHAQWQDIQKLHSKKRLHSLTNAALIYPINFLECIVETE